MPNLFRRFRRNVRGNVATMFAFAAIPILLLIGMGVDYGLAADRRSRLTACADAATLAAVAPAMLDQSAEAARQTALTTFMAEAGAITGITLNAGNVTVTVGQQNGRRAVTVAFAAESQNYFPSLLGSAAFHLTGSSTSEAGKPPDIDFYLLLDSSPSMALAATQSGINTMVAATPSQGGCAFGCHQTNPAADNLGNPGGIDNYQLARNLGVALRIDVLRDSTKNLMTTAASSAQQYGSNYRMAIYTFDVQLNTIRTLTTDLGAAQSAASNVQMLVVDHNNYLTASNRNNDTDSNFDAALQGVNSIMPTPGTGTTKAGDTPQEVLFFVTDGVEDEMVWGSRRLSVVDTGQCTAIKNRGIRIAVLYTEYLPLPTNAFYNDHIASFQANIAPALQQCASPGLFVQVVPGGDISAAMINLFQMAVSAAHISK